MIDFPPRRQARRHPRRWPRRVPAAAAALVPAGGGGSDGGQPLRTLAQLLGGGGAGGMPMVLQARGAGAGEGAISMEFKVDGGTPGNIWQVGQSAAESPRLWQSGLSSLIHLSALIVIAYVVIADSLVVTDCVGGGRQDVRKYWQVP